MEFRVEARVNELDVAAAGSCLIVIGDKLKLDLLTGAEGVEIELIFRSSKGEDDANMAFSLAPGVRFHGNQLKIDIPLYGVLNNKGLNKPLKIGYIAGRELWLNLLIQGVLENIMLLSYTFYLGSKIDGQA